MNLPVVAIVGRPNVGKSSLFNVLAGERISIVDETPGVTRDRVSRIVTHGDVTMEIVDTGGIGIVDRDDLGAHVERQIDHAVRLANVILLLVDVKDGVTVLDREVATKLRERSKEIPLILVVNKVDNASLENLVGEFYALGLGEPVPISALHRRGTRDILDRVIEKVWPTGDVDVDPVMKLAVVGRQNVGKSTFVNAIAREDRMIVSEVPGTTRDAVDVHFEKDGRRFVIIDTAGAKKISKAKHAIEVYSQFRTENAIRRADVVLLLLDASQEITRIDKSLGDFIATESKVCIIVANKWDLVREASTTERYAEYLTARFPLLGYAPIVFTTARDSRNIQSTLDLAQHLFKKSILRFNTGEVNRVLEAAGDHRMPRSKGKRVPKMYYGTQVAASPPTFVIFVNEPHLFPDDYRRYLERAFREALGFDEIPLRLIFRGRDRTEEGSKGKPEKGGRRPGRERGEGPGRGGERPGREKGQGRERGGERPGRGGGEAGERGGKARTGTRAERVGRQGRSDSGPGREGSERGTPRERGPARGGPGGKHEARPDGRRTEDRKPPRKAGGRRRRG